MTAPIRSCAAATTALTPARWLPIEPMGTVERIARRIDAWVGALRRAAADRDALACMSDRELLDIGIVRASVDAVADGRWARDRPW